MTGERPRKLVDLPIWELCLPTHAARRPSDTLPTLCTDPAMPVDDIYDSFSPRSLQY